MDAQQQQQPPVAAADAVAVQAAATGQQQQPRDPLGRFVSPAASAGGTAPMDTGSVAPAATTVAAAAATAVGASDPMLRMTQLLQQLPESERAFFLQYQAQLVEAQNAELERIRTENAKLAQERERIDNENRMMTEQSTRTMIDVIKGLLEETRQSRGTDAYSQQSLQEALNGMGDPELRESLSALTKFRQGQKGLGFLVQAASKARESFAALRAIPQQTADTSAATLAELQKINKRAYEGLSRSVGPQVAAAAAAGNGGAMWDQQLPPAKRQLTAAASHELPGTFAVNMPIHNTPDLTRQMPPAYLQYLKSFSTDQVAAMGAADSQRKMPTTAVATAAVATAAAAAAVGGAAARRV